MKELYFDISNDWLNIIIFVSTLLIALISFYQELGKIKHLKFIKSLTIRLICLIGCSTLILWATVVKEKNSDIRNSNDLYTRDKLNQDYLNASLQKTSKAYSSATASTMAKYYLLYNAAQHKVEKLVKDSAKLVSNDPPFVQLCDVTRDDVNGVSKFTFALCTPSGTATNFNFQNDCVIRSNTNELTYFKSRDNGNSSLTSVNGESFSMHFSDIDVAKIERIYIYLYGNYEDLKGDKYQLNYIVSYGIVDKMIVKLTPKEEDWIARFFKQNGIDHPKNQKANHH